jgi:serine/threonine protein kinase
MGLFSPSASSGFVAAYRIDRAEALGSGRFSTVRRAVRKRDGIAVAAKKVEYRRGSVEEQESRERWALRELEVMELLVRRGGHPNVVRLLDSFFGDGHVILALELLSGGELIAAIKQRGALPEAMCAKVCAELCAGLAFLHAVGIMHRDIQPANLCRCTARTQHLHAASRSR